MCAIRHCHPASRHLMVERSKLAVLRVDLSIIQIIKRSDAHVVMLPHAQWFFGGRGKRRRELERRSLHPAQVHQAAQFLRQVVDDLPLGRECITYFHIHQQKRKLIEQRESVGQLTGKFTHWDIRLQAHTL